MASTRAFLASLLCLGVTVSAGGQQAPGFTDSITVTASGEPRDAAETCAAVTVIGPDEIRATDHAAAAGLLRVVPGATLLRSGGDGNVASLFVRGTASTQTLVLFDGVRLNSPYFGGYDWSLPLTAGVDRIEVVRGPYSALYGGDAIGGVVQLVPARARGTRVRVLAEGGSDSWRRGELEASVGSGPLSVLATVAGRDGTGPLPNDDFSSRVGMVDVGLDLADGGRIGLLARATRSRTEIPFAGARATPNRRTEAEETVLAVPLRLHLGATTALEISLSRVARDLRFRDPDDPSGFLASRTEADSAGASATLRGVLGRQRLAVGGEWRRDEVTDGSSYGVALAGRTLSTGALFIQDGAELGRGFEFGAGLRWDEADPWGGEVSPRVTVGWARGPVRAWVAQGRAFRAPGLGDLYYPFTGNPDLVPERSRSLEAGTRVALGSAGATLEAVAFRNRIRDLIDFDFATQRSANIARASQDGAELALVVPAGGGRTRASLTWLDARDGAGLRLPRRPEWSSSLVWYGALAGTLEGAAELVWVGPRPDLDPVTYSRVALAGFVTANAAVGLPLGRELTLRLRVENLADRAYEEVRGYPAPGRRVIAGLEVR